MAPSSPSLFETLSELIFESRIHPSFWTALLEQHARIELSNGRTKSVVIPAI